MEILLLRHGQASWQAKTDMERELTPRGESEVAGAAQWLEASGWRPDQIWVSPYRRAQQTAAIINRHWQLPQRSKASLTPDSELDELEAMIATFKGERLMLIGHNPLLTNAIGRWHGDSQRYWGLETASMALLEGDVFAAGCASLKWLRHYPNYDHNGR